ncbi:MAG: hypothetical protein KatS3mg109_1953 [Pirellulaceae bacterium]|nr:MAG: hypothetical protein KatS3mg109_1953 [Pirellulaceae bacterium]
MNRTNWIELVLSGGRLTSKRKNRKRRANTRRTLMLEALEDRRLLNASPIARNDLAYYTPVDQPLVVDSTSSLLVNDFDPDGGTLSASVVTNPQNGTLTDFDPTSGTFTYVPNAGFSGIDRFTYQLSGGQANSPLTTVQIAVGGPFSGKLNEEEFSPRRVAGQRRWA